MIGVLETLHLSAHMLTMASGWLPHWLQVNLTESFLPTCGVSTMCTRRAWAQPCRAGLKSRECDLESSVRPHGIAEMSLPSLETCFHGTYTDSSIPP